MPWQEPSLTSSAPLSYGLVGILITVTVGHDDDIYKWESTKLKAIGLDVVGFAILTVGNLIYH